MHFCGDIVITDPCYIVLSNEDWVDSQFGESLGELGFKTFLTFDRGDSVGESLIDRRNGEVLGRFCTDSCMVSVMLLSEVVEYNPAFSETLAKHCYTIVKDFDGVVEQVELEDGYWMLSGKGNIDFCTEFQ